MSVDNWGRCPRCYRRAEVALEKQTEDVDASYGVVSIDVFEASRKALAQAEIDLDNPDNLRTFREDWDFSGLEDGLIEVHYRGSCAVCKLSVEFKHAQPIKGIGD